MAVTGTGMGNFAVWLKDARDHAGLLQLELAEKIGVSKQYLSDIEQGRRLPPSDKHLVLLAKALHHPSDVVFCRAGRLPPDLREIDQDNNAVWRAIVAFRDALKGDQ